MVALIASSVSAEAQSYKSFGPDAAATQQQKIAWCDGFNQAIEMIKTNRDHYRALLGAPTMSQEEVLLWIYSRPWRDDATHRTAPRRLGQPDGEPQIGPAALESVDLYLIPVIAGCSITPDGKIELKMLELDKIRK